MPMRGTSAKLAVTLTKTVTTDSQRVKRIFFRASNSDTSTFPTVSVKMPGNSQRNGDVAGANAGEKINSTATPAIAHTARQAKAVQRITCRATTAAKAG